MASVPEVTALDALSAAERSVVLTQLLLARPELRPEAETIAATVLSAGDIGQIGEDVAAELRNLPISDLAGRAGPPGDGGYMEPHEAANEMLAEIVRPYLDDIACRAGLGAQRAARDIGLGVLLGLYSCREDDGSDKVLTHAEMPDAVDDLARTVFEALRKARVRLPSLSDECPEWADWDDSE